MERIDSNRRELPMPLTSVELIVLAKSLKAVLNSEEMVLDGYGHQCGLPAPTRSGISSQP
jgi:hypothetical protein